MSAGLHISLNAETLFHLGSLPISNSMFTSTIASLLILSFGFLVKISLDQKTIRPTGLQNLAEWIVESFLNFINSVTGDLKKSQIFLPSLATFFIFIVLNNWLGLLPIVGSVGLKIPQESKVESIQQLETTPIDSAHEVAEPVKHEKETFVKEEKHEKFVPVFRPGTADLNTTIALALTSVFLIQFFGFKFLKLSYLNKFFNFSSPVNFYVGILELISEFAKIISFAFRLFGNIFAGEVLLVVITYLTKVLMPIPFYGLEIFVGFIQALVFTMLSLVFYNMATAKSH